MFLQASRSDSRHRIADLNRLAAAATTLLGALTIGKSFLEKSTDDHPIPKTCLAEITLYINSFVEKQKEVSQLETLTVAHDVMHQIVSGSNMLDHPFKPELWRRTDRQGRQTERHDPRYLSKLCEIFVEMLCFFLDLGMSSASVPSDQHFGKYLKKADWLAKYKTSVREKLKKQLQGFDIEGMVGQRLRSEWSPRPWAVLLVLFTTTDTTDLSCQNAHAGGASRKRVHDQIVEGDGQSEPVQDGITPTKKSRT